MDNNDLPDVDHLLRLLAEQTIEHAILLLDTEGRIRCFSNFIDSAAKVQVRSDGDGESKGSEFAVRLPLRST